MYSNHFAVVDYRNVSLHQVVHIVTTVESCIT